MKKLILSIYERSVQRYDADFTEEDYAEYLKYLKGLIGHEYYNIGFARAALPVFEQLTFEDILDIMTDKKPDIFIDVVYEDGTKSSYSVTECIWDWVHEYIYDDCPEYIDSEEFDEDIDIVEE